MFLRFMSYFFILSFSLWPVGKSAEETPVTVQSSNVKLKKTSLDIPANLKDFENVRVSLMKNVTSVTISSPQAFKVVDEQGHDLLKGDKIVAATVKANDRGIQLGSQTFLGNALVIRSTAGDGIKVGDKTYRDNIEFWKDAAGKISVINEVNLEDYLKGVLPWEANPNWPVEALKAQAVVSRTYGLFKAIEYQKEKTHVSQDVLSQVYAGKTVENPKTSQAVDLTKGEILTYNGKIFPAYFHSTCGGATTHADYLWDVEPNPALKGVKCDFCWESKHYHWSAEISPLEMEKALQKKGYTISGITNITLEDTDETGRARYIIVDHAKGKTKFRSNDFRVLVDPMKFKSTLIKSITRKGSSFVFQGKGWGHGAGMCQYGSKALAELGYTYRQILDYYYPGSKITTLEN